MQTKYPKAYIEYLCHFHGDRDYFECHEVLEEYWKEYTTQERDSIWVALILLAVSFYHFRRGNKAGAKKTALKSLNLCSNLHKELEQLGLNPVKVMKMLEAHLSDIHHQRPYKSPSLPIIDPELQFQCNDFCMTQSFSFGQESDLSRSDLLHRHKMRDRSEIIELRKLALSKRAKKTELD
jgi:predicted metal-dependent hydrolase